MTEHSVIIAPFHGWPKAEVTFGPSRITITALNGSSRRLVFDESTRDYDPNPESHTLTEQARDVVDFAMLLVERPEDFAREPENVEQRAADWWQQYGEEFMAELNSMIEDES